MRLAGTKERDTPKTRLVHKFTRVFDSHAHFLGTMSVGTDCNDLAARLPESLEKAERGEHLVTAIPQPLGVHLDSFPTSGDNSQDIPGFFFVHSEALIAPACRALPFYQIEVRQYIKLRLAGEFHQRFEVHLDSFLDHCGLDSDDGLPVVP
jgi:hypothetical protein